METNQYQINRVQLKTVETLQDVAHTNKHQQDFINGLCDRVTKVEELLQGMARSVTLRTTVEAWEEKFDFLEKNVLLRKQLRC